jgi:hypothetical protein
MARTCPIGSNETASDLRCHLSDGRFLRASDGSLRVRCGLRDGCFRMIRGANDGGLGNLHIGLDPGFRLHDGRRGMVKNAVDVPLGFIPLKAADRAWIDIRRSDRLAS